MELYKAHGTGNDFLVLPDPDGRIDLSASMVVDLCDRHFGLGADGVLRLAPSDDAHVFMDYRNGGDGAPVEMCGNGVRVVARHLLDHGWTDDRTQRIETRAGIRTVTIDEGPDGSFQSATVDMGPPGFALDALPFHGGRVDDHGWHHLDVDGEDVALLPVSMGNPHAVLLVDEPATAPVTTLGPVLERDEAFPKGTNVEFVAVRDGRTLDLRVWERGVGETMACGTGVCGAVAALTADGRLDPGHDVTVTVPGGTLVVRWSGEEADPVLLTGPAEEVARIELDGDWAARHGLSALVDT
jgi:diaminopimelate epimerase